MLRYVFSHIYRLFLCEEISSHISHQTHSWERENTRILTAFPFSSHTIVISSKCGWLVFADTKRPLTLIFQILYCCILRHPKNTGQVMWKSVNALRPVKHKLILWWWSASSEVIWSILAQNIGKYNSLAFATVKATWHLERYSNGKCMQINDPTCQLSDPVQQWTTNRQKTQEAHSHVACLASYASSG